MGPKGIVVAFACLACLALGQAAAQQTPPDVAQALQRAERAVAEARTRGALWTTAQEALERARAAAARGDAATALAAARLAAEQAELGLAQRAYPRLDQ